MSDLYPILDWQPVLLVKTAREPFAVTQSGLSVKRAYLALHPDGVVYSAWDIPENERIYPRVLLVGWKPMRDVPFTPPVQFFRKGDPRVSTIIPSGTWILPYDDELYTLYLGFQQQVQSLMQQIEVDPLADTVRATLTRLVDSLED
jgi:hypothetical protein